VSEDGSAVCRRLADRVGLSLAATLTQASPRTFASWLEGSGPVAPLAEKRAHVALRVCGIIGSALDNADLRDWWKARTTTFAGASPADFLSRARDDREYDVLLDTAERYAGGQEGDAETYDGWRERRPTRTEQRERYTEDGQSRGHTRRVAIDE
jgi:hypothetical protein